MFVFCVKFVITYIFFSWVVNLVHGLGNCDERKLVKPVKGIEYVPTYEDKDGDLMLVGDVPWK